jgi:hypothetical protein
MKRISLNIGLATAFAAVFGLVGTAYGSDPSQREQPAPETAATSPTETPQFDREELSAALTAATRSHPATSGTVDSPDAASGAGVEATALDTASKRLSFQARLTDASGNPLPGPLVDLEFRVYNEQGGPLTPFILVEEVPITDGVVSTFFPVSADIFTGSARELGVTVNGGVELAPRIQLTAVPYAYRVDRVASGELDDDIRLGSMSADGLLRVFSDAAGAATIELDGSSGDVNTSEAFNVVDAIGGSVVGKMTGVGALGGEITLNDTLGNNAVRLTANVLTGGGLAEFYQGAGDGVGVVILGDALVGSLMDMMDSSGATTIHMQSDTISGGGASMSLRSSEGVATVAFDGDDGDAGTMRMRDANGDVTVTMSSKGTGSETGKITITDGDSDTIRMFGHTNFGSCLEMYDRNETRTISLFSSWSGGDDGGGRIVVRDPTGSIAIDLNGESGVTKTRILTITGGADLSEQFDIEGPTGSLEPGTVVCIDSANVGKLTVCTSEYDTTVAGIISGAGGIQTGMMMGQRGTVADGGHPVALSGRVYVHADASAGSIRPGDLLTTSSRSGHAMRVTDNDRAHGAIIGKAMSSLSEGTGLVLVLVSLH